VAVANGAAGMSALWAVVGIVPVEGLAGRNGLALEQRSDAHAVQRIANRDVAGGADRGGEIHRDGWHVAGGAGLCVPRPADDERDANAALVQVTLAFAQRSVVRGG